MAYVDKCCGVCDEYVDLTIIGEEWCEYSQKCYPRYRRTRFEVANVCKSCVDKKPLKGVHVSTLKLHTTMDRGGQRWSDVKSTCTRSYGRWVL